jgi:purine-binding chemotaxis protein CheW
VASDFDPLRTILAGRERVRTAGTAEFPESCLEELPNGFLWFTVGGENYAVHIKHIKEVIRTRRVTPVPRSPAALTGIISHRGALIPILDLAGRFGVENSVGFAAQRIIVVRKGEGYCGLLVNRVGRVVMRRLSEIGAAPRELPVALHAFVSGAIRYKGALLFLLELDKILDIG